MSLNQVTASAIETLVSQLLSLDAEAESQLQPLNNKSILIQLEDWQLDYLFIIEDSSVKVSDNKVSHNINSESKNDIKRDVNNDFVPSASIRGKLPSFIAAALAEQSGDAIFQGDLHFSGDINTAKQFQHLAANLEIDWGEPISKIFGDFLGHSIITSLSVFGNWAVNVKESLKQDISEYVQEEAKVTASDAEQQVFFEEVDLIRSRADRLIARAEQTINAINQSKKAE